MKRLFLLLCLMIAALAAYVWTRPSQFRIERSAVIDAPQEVVFSNLDDFRRWVPWSAWEKLDPAMERTYGGPERGVGANYSWRGNEEVGAGRMTVTQSDPPRRLTIRLEFIEPMQVTNETVFDVSPHIAGTTEVRWAMTGYNGFVQKAFGLFMDVDAMVGNDFEKGLAELKRVSEEQAAAEAAKRAAEATEAATAEEGAPAPEGAAEEEGAVPPEEGAAAQPPPSEAP